MTKLKLVKQSIFFMGVCLLANQAMAYDCDAIIRDGKFDSTSVLEQGSALKVFSGMYCNDNNASLNLRLPDGEDIGLSTKNAYCRKTLDQQASSFKFQEIVKRVNQQLVDAWEKCVQIQSPHWHFKLFVPEDDSKRISFELGFSKAGYDHIPYPKITDFIPGNLTCTNGYSEGDEIGAVKQVSCERVDPCDSSTIIINTDNGSPLSLSQTIISAHQKWVPVQRSLSNNEPLPRTENWEVAGCRYSCDGDSNNPTGAPNGDCVSHDYKKADGSPDQFKFGDWKNKLCNNSGSGWHTHVGTCGFQSQGKPGYKRCERVDIVSVKAVKDPSCSVP